MSRGTIDVVVTVTATEHDEALDNLTNATELGNAASGAACDAVAIVTATEYDEAVENIATATGHGNAVSSSSSATQQTSCITSSGQVISADKATAVCAGPAPRPDTLNPSQPL